MNLSPLERRNFCKLTPRSLVACSNSFCLSSCPDKNGTLSSVDILGSIELLLSIESFILASQSCVNCSLRNSQRKTSIQPECSLNFRVCSTGKGTTAQSVEHDGAESSQCPSLAILRLDRSSPGFNDAHCPGLRVGNGPTVPGYKASVGLYFKWLVP